MINSCLNKSSKKTKKRYDSLQSKYNASEEALDHAIYSWGNLNEDKVEEEGGIDIEDTELEDYLDDYFKTKSNYNISSKRKYDKLHTLWEEGQRKVEWNTSKGANKRYDLLVSIFGKDNVVKYHTPEGTIIVRAAEPIYKKESNTANTPDTNPTTKKDKKSSSSQDTANKIKWARTSENSYEVSTKGDKRFSALNAKFKKGTIIEGVDVSGMSIDDVYQSVIKKSGKGKAPSKGSKLHSDNFGKSFKGFNSKVRQVLYTNQSKVPVVYFLDSDGIERMIQFDGASRGWSIWIKDQNSSKYYADENSSREDAFKKAQELYPQDIMDYIYDSQKLFSDSLEEQAEFFRKSHNIHYINDSFIGTKEGHASFQDFSYYEGYLPLWQEWARQNPELMQELREKSAGKVLTDKFANTRVSQARALAEILNSESSQATQEQSKDEKSSKVQEALSKKDIIKKLSKATVIWGHPASGKTYLFKDGRKDIIDFDSEYKTRINKLMGLPEGLDAKELRKAARKERKQEYHDHIMNLFDEAVKEAKRTGKKLLVSDLMLLEEREADIDIITNMSDAKFIENSALRKETDVDKLMLWKNDINKAIKNIKSKNKIINTDKFLSDILPKSKAEKAKDKLNEVIKEISDRVHFDKESHIYTVYPSARDKKEGTNGKKAISVSQYLYGKKKDIEEGWAIPSLALGNTNDAVIRDYFNNNLQKSYPNMNAEQLKAFIQDIKKLERKFKEIHGEDCIVITKEFPIVGQYTVTVNGKSRTKYIAGTMDMIVIDENGKYWGYDMKAKRSGMKVEDIIDYGNQLGLYDSILSPYGIEFEDTQIIQTEVWYDGSVDVTFGKGNAEYTVDDEGQLYDKGVKIQDTGHYSPFHITFTEKDNPRFNTFVPVKLDEANEKMMIEIESLPQEDKDLIEEEFGSKVTTESSSMKYSDRKKSVKSGLYNPILPASERKFLAEQVMHQVSFIITHLQTSEEAAAYYFPDSKFASIDFTSMNREDIINTIGIGRLFSVVKNIFKSKLYNASTEDVYNKLDVAVKYFDDLINEGYAKLIELESTSVTQTEEAQKIIEDLGDENIPEDNDSATLEEKEHEYWQLGQRQISAKSSLSKEIRRMFERLQVLDKKGNPVSDNYGYGFYTFVDANTAVNNILDWCKDCTTIEEMETILKEKSESTPYLNTILEKIKEEPIRSLFFKNFRKDFTTYSIIRVSYDSNGKRVFSTHTINTKGAARTILDNLTVSYKSGLMQGIIKTRDTVEGKGKVNVKNVEAIIKEKERITRKIDNAFGNNSKMAKVLKEESVAITTILNKLGIQVLSKTVFETIKNDYKKPNSQDTNAFKILQKVGYMTTTLLNNKDRTDYNPMLKEEENTESSSKGNIFSDYQAIVDILKRNIEDSIEASTYENGKMYYSFVTPSYMGALMTNLKGAIEDSTQDDSKFKRFLKDNYSKYRWFYDSKNPDDKKWLNVWLKRIATNTADRNLLAHKVQLHFDKTPYNELSELGYTMSLMQEFFADKNKRWAWYRVPILSNKPSSEFIRFARYSGKSYKRNIKQGLSMVFIQEILRIQTVLERAALSEDSGVEKIKSYDINLKLLKDSLGEKQYRALIERIKGKKINAADMVAISKASASKGEHSGAEFRFLEMLNNEFIENTDLSKLIINKINDKKVDEEELLDKLIGTRDGKNNDGVFDKYMDMIVEKEMAHWNSMGLFETEEITTKNKKGETKTTTRYKYLSQLGEDIDEIEHNLEEYVWNDMFATINIIQLTVTDLAYYKNMEDFQKRYAQVHSPALRLNTSAEYKGVKVSDGKARTLYIKDSNIKSEIIPIVKDIFDKKIASLEKESEKKEMKAMADLILSSFERVNVTDAQGYSSPTSYRKKMIMAGMWDDTMEKAYQKIASGNFNVNDLGVVWQPLKPFVYSQISKSTGVSKMSEIKVPIQNKNSEYMLLMADALMRGANKNSTLRAIFDFMEDSHKEVDENGKPIEGTYRQDGIDTVQFESAVKSGLMGVIDINNKSYKEIKKILESKAYYSNNKQASKDNKMDRYNDQFVHTIPFSDYGIQQEVPAHLVDHMQAMGSQIRILSISDISDTAKFEIHNKEGKWDKKYIIDRYQKLIADNIKESFDELAEEFNIKSKNKKERNKALSKVLVKAIQNDQRYGADLLRACSIDEQTGEFIIPLSDPIQSQRIQQLINSIIKSRINKQEVQGGPVVQASVFGVSDDLHIIFKDKNGDLQIPRDRKAKETDEEYKEYLDKFYEKVSKNRGSMAYMEVYMPIPSKALEKKLTRTDGSIMSPQDAIDAGIISEEMLKAIGYRI